MNLWQATNLLNSINASQGAEEVEKAIIAWAEREGLNPTPSEEGIVLPAGGTYTFSDPKVEAFLDALSRILAHCIEMSTDLQTRTTTIRILRRISDALAHMKPGRREMELVERILAEELGAKGIILLWRGEMPLVIYSPKGIPEETALTLFRLIPDQTGIHHLSHEKYEGTAIVRQTEDGTYTIILLGDIRVDPDLLRLLSAVMIPEMRSIVLDRTASTDNLTGLLRRERLMALLVSLWQFAKSSGIPIGLIMIDIDHFKHINDTYGHHVGDQVLRHVASLIRVMAPRMSLVGRYGGEEFLVAVADTRMGELKKVAEAIRLAVAETPAQTDAGEIPVTVSLGIHLAEPRHETPEEAIKKADEAMYKAKASGRNRVEVL